MITVEAGQRLMQARTEQQLSLEEVSDQLKLHTSQLQALESGDWSLLPHDALATGFLRQYARLLSVDVEDTLTRLKSEPLNLKSPHTFPDPGIAPSWRWATAAAVLFVVLLIGWNTMDRHADTSPPPMEETPQIEPSQPVIAESAKPEPQPSVSPPHAPTPAIQAPVAITTKPSLSTIDPLPTPAILPKTGIQLAPYQEDPKARVPPKKAESTPTLPTEHAAMHLYRFIAGNERVWLNIALPQADGSSKTYRDIILRPTHSLEVNLSEDSLIFSCGNAGALKIEVDGVTRFDFGQLGAKGMVLRHRKLTATRQKQ